MKLKSNEGITLVALVVTIIVLLIFAGVSISMVFDSEGLFEKANSAAHKYNSGWAPTVNGRDVNTTTDLNIAGAWGKPRLNNKEDFNGLEITLYFVDDNSLVPIH